jgi:cyclophilin family peptidyl-prolyl cis-trans isomerase
MSRKEQRALRKLATMQLGLVAQVIAVLLLMVLVWEAHHNAGLATDQLIQFKQDESLLLLHLQKIEQQSIQLHENLRSRVGESASYDGFDLDDIGIDLDVLKDQTEELYQMETELKQEVLDLQTKIQASSVQHIVREFGEGPVKVLLDLEGMGRISVLLWPDAPHAAWTWLEQISRHVWDGATLAWTDPNVIDGFHTQRDPLNRGKLEFVENHNNERAKSANHNNNNHNKRGGHEAWTVGLKQTELGNLGMFINLQDNNQYYKHETSVGKIIDGFDALQKLLEVSRSVNNSNSNEQDSNSQSSVRILSASAMHITQRESLMLVGKM